MNDDKDWKQACDELFEASDLYSELRDGDVILVPMRVEKPKMPPNYVGIRPLHVEKTSIGQSGRAALMLLTDARWTCSMCERYRAFRDIPNEGYCECEGRVKAWREVCGANFRER